MFEPLRVVVIEDDADTRSNMQDILELDQCMVRTASGLRDALQLEGWHEVDAVVLDRRLSDGSAEELLPKLRQLAPQAAVIVITAYADLDSTIGAMRHGVYDYILKPINPDALRASLRRVRQLIEARRQLLQSERLAAVGQMVTGLAHESRNALQRSQACLELLRLEVEDRPQALELCDRIQKALDDLSRLYEQVRSYAAPLILDRQEVELAVLWRRAWRELEYQWSDKQLHLVERVKCPTSLYYGDPFALEQVFRNLLENAIHASPVRGTVQVECRHTTLHGQPVYAVCIRDEGPGVAQEHRGRVFEPFFTTKTKGTGLGLAIARRIVEAHGGKLLLGNPPQGAEFVVILSLGLPQGERQPASLETALTAQ